MIFTSTELDGVVVIDAEPHRDERGTFTRTFCRAAFVRHGLDPHVEQCSIATNRVRGTLRGMHYQAGRRPERRLVRCIRGAVYDVVVDLRAGSPTHRRWIGVELAADDGRALYVPEGCAHGYLTLVADTHLAYQMSAAYDPAAACGVRFDDPALAIDWPSAPVLVSPRDRAHPLLRRP